MSEENKGVVKVRFLIALISCFLLCAALSTFGPGMTFELFSPYWWGCTIFSTLGGMFFWTCSFVFLEN